MLTPQRSFFVENTVPRWREILSRYLLQAITAIGWVEDGHQGWF
jgi:hypothetical protein